VETAVDVVEATADTVAELALGAVALASDVVGESESTRRLGRSLFKLLVVALLVAVAVGAVAKLKGKDAPAHNDAA
jgi:hypothetical protein